MPDKKTSILVSLLIVVIIIGILGCYLISREKRRIAQILAVEVQKEQAVREIEVSIWETSNALFYYLVEPSKTAAEEYRKQLGDVREFQALYRKLIDSEEEKAMLAEFNKLWADSISRAQQLIELRDEMADIADKVWDAVHKVDDIINYKIQPAFVDGTPDLVEKEKAIREVEVSILGAAYATQLYLSERSDIAKRELSLQLDNVNEFWEKYKRFYRSSADEPPIKEFDKSWREAVVLMQKCILIADALKNKELLFWEAVHAADDVVDFEIQLHLKKRLNKFLK